MIDLETLKKLKAAEKALDICRLELCKPMRRKRLNFSRLYDQHQIGWSIIGQLLAGIDPAYTKRKSDRVRMKNKWLEKRRKNEKSSDASIASTSRF